MLAAYRLHPAFDVRCMQLRISWTFGEKKPSQKRQSPKMLRPSKPRQARAAIKFHRNGALSCLLFRQFTRSTFASLTPTRHHLRICFCIDLYRNRQSIGCIRQRPRAQIRSSRARSRWPRPHGLIQIQSFPTAAFQVFDQPSSCPASPELQQIGRTISARRSENSRSPSA